MPARVDAGASYAAEVERVFEIFTSGHVPFSASLVDEVEPAKGSQSPHEHPPCIGAASRMYWRIALAFIGNALFHRLSSFLFDVGLPWYGRVTIYVIVAGGLLLGSIWHWQESILYVPALPNPSNPAFGGTMKRPQDCPEGFRSPTERGLEFEDVQLECSDGVKCHAWFIPAANRELAPTILFSHENAGPMSLRLPLIEVLRHHLRANVLCYDYRGYGNSDQVQIDETGLMRDAHAAWRWLVGQSRVDATRIVLFGSSLGGAVTIQLARDLCKSKSQDATLPLPLGVVLMNTFTSIEAML